MNAALERFVPGAEVAGLLDEHYTPSDPDTRLDVLFPRALAGRAGSLVTIVWIHGGAFGAGSKAEVRNYARILAAHGFTVVALDYSLAPGSTYPTPVRQVNQALAYLVANATRLHVDPRPEALARLP